MSTNLRDPKTVSIPLQDGSTKDYIVHKFHAIAGREIVTQYPLTAAPKIGDYKTNEELMLRIMGYVGVPMENGNTLLLTTRTLVENHIPDWEALVRLEWAAMEHNCSFFANGKASSFFENLTQAFTSKGIAILTDSLARLSEKSTPRSES